MTKRKIIWMFVICFAVALVFVGRVRASDTFAIQRLKILIGVFAILALIGMCACIAFVLQRKSWSNWIIGLIGVVFSLGIGEALGWIYFESNERSRGLRKQLINNAQVMKSGLVAQQLGTPQPYLLYVPTPGRDDNNSQGYRGKPVSINRQTGVTRVLCLGGSTTYGDVANADDAYPAQLEKILRQLPGSDKRKVEVINGGLPYGTTAELLTHYHFKFHYFQPDCVIINTGGNDAGAARAQFYQPDYSHFRQPLRHYRALSPLGQGIMKSKLGSLLMLSLLTAGETSSMDKRENRPPTVWFPTARDGRSGESVPDEDLAFTHNLNSLIELIHRDGATVILVPFRVNPEFYDSSWYPGMERSERILKQIAEKRELVIAPFPKEVISQENWMDFCHLNPNGCRQKAEHIAPFVVQCLWP